MRKTLRQYRLKSGMTVEQIAKIIKVAPSTYYKWEDGSRSPNIKKAILIAKILGSTVEELFFDELLDKKSK